MIFGFTLSEVLFSGLVIVGLYWVYVAWQKDAMNKVEKGKQEEKLSNEEAVRALDELLVEQQRDS